MKLTQKPVKRILTTMIALLVFAIFAPFAAFADDAADHVDLSIATDRDIYTSGEMAQVTVKYTIDPGTISPGDSITIHVDESIASQVSFSVSHQHFSEVEELGAGAYRLVFGEDATTALAGSFRMLVVTNADEATEGTIESGYVVKSIEVIPATQGENGTGTYEDEALMKDGLGSDGIWYGGYDYSDGDETQYGLFDSSVDHVFTYRLYVNRKNVSMKDVTVSDELPDGMYFPSDAAVECYYMDPDTYQRTDRIFENARISILGQNLTVVLGDI